MKSGIGVLTYMIMAINSCFSVIPLRFIMLLLCLSLGLVGTSSAEIRFSYNTDLSASQAADGGYVESKPVYFFWESSGNGAEATEATCCVWVSGPGSSDRFESVSMAPLASGSMLIDLSGYYPGSVRRVSFEVAGVRYDSVFVVGRVEDYKPIELATSGPVVATADGQVIENLKIVAGTSNACAITVSGRKDVVIRNVDIEHKNQGICVVDSPGTTISSVRLFSSAAPEIGPHCIHGEPYCGSDNRVVQAKPDERLNIRITRSDDTRIEFVEAEKGASAVYVVASDNVEIVDIRCLDARGPYPRGNCVQLNQSDHGVVKNFYIKNVKNVSHELDNISIYKADYAHISHGLLDGSFSINGVGVIADWGSDYTTITDVDFIRTTNSAVAVFAGEKDAVGRGFVANNIRIRDTHCTARGVNRFPSSGGLAVSIHPEAINPSITNAIFWNHCRTQANWCVSSSCRTASGGVFDIREKDFQLKKPLQLMFPWEESRPTIIDAVVK